MSLADEIAKNRAADRKDLDRTMERHEKEFETLDRRKCPGCIYTWNTVAGIYARPTIWIPEAQAYWHLRCWQRHKEAK